MKFARKATTAVGLALTLGLSGLAPIGPVAYAAEDAVVHDGSSTFTTAPPATRQPLPVMKLNKSTRMQNPVSTGCTPLRCQLHSSSTATRRLTAAVGF